MTDHTTALYFYLGTFGTLLLAGLGFPIPEEIPIVVAGAAVGHAAEPATAVPPALLMAVSASPMADFPANLPYPLLVSNYLEGPRFSPLPSALRWWIMLPICIVGAVIGDVFLYAFGRFGGRRLMRLRFVKRLMTAERERHIEENFHRYGLWVLVFARFLPTIRSPIFITAGILRVPFLRFLLADGLAGLIGVSLLFGLAFWFGDQFRDLVLRAEGSVEKLKPLLVLLGLTVVASWMFFLFVRKPVATGDPDEIPILGEKVVETLHLDPGHESAGRHAASESGKNSQDTFAGDARGQDTARKSVPES